MHVHSVVASGFLLVGLAAAVGCGRTSPLSPDPAAAGLSSLPRTAGVAPVVRPAAGPETTIPLFAGVFLVQNGAGDSISATYTGTARSGSGSAEKAAITVQITGGTGAYSGAVGRFEASGAGAFADEGAFTLDAKADIVVAGGRHAQLLFNLAGTASVSCTASSQIAITQTAEGTMGRAGRVRAMLYHQLGNTGCSA